MVTIKFQERFFPPKVQAQIGSLVFLDFSAKGQRENQVLDLILAQRKPKTYLLPTYC